MTARRRKSATGLRGDKMVMMRVNAKHLVDPAFKKMRKKMKVPTFKPMKVPKFKIAGATRCKKG
jgi:hypothetical protein